MMMKIKDLFTKYFIFSIFLLFTRAAILWSCCSQNIQPIERTCPLCKKKPEKQYGWFSVSCRKSPCTSLLNKHGTTIHFFLRHFLFAHPLPFLHPKDPHSIKRDVLWFIRSKESCIVMSLWPDHYFQSKTFLFMENLFDLNHHVKGKV